MAKKKAAPKADKGPNKSKAIRELIESGVTETADIQEAMKTKHNIDVSYQTVAAARRSMGGNLKKDIATLKEAADKVGGIAELKKLMKTVNSVDNVDELLGVIEMLSK